jgi:tetratricopeptide (TPR) repeat protein
MRIGDFARDIDEYEQAIHWYKEAVDFLPAQRGEGMYRLASCHEDLGKYQVALSWYRQIDQEPWRVRGYLAAAKLLERQNRTRDAIKIYEGLAKESIPEAGLIKERLAALRGN